MEDEIINASLLHHGKEVDPDRLYMEIHRNVKEEHFRWPVSPAEWQVLLALRSGGGVLKEEQLMADKDLRERLSDLQIGQAIKNLLTETIDRRSSWIEVKTERTRKVREYFYTYGKKTVGSEVGEERIYSLRLDEDARRLLYPKFKTAKAGDEEHVQMIMNALRHIIWPNGWIARVDTGETVSSIPDILISLTKMAKGEDGLKGRIDPDEWDYDKSFAVEVETDPTNHWDRVQRNIERNAKLKLPTAIAVPSEETAKEVEKRLLRQS